MTVFSFCSLMEYCRRFIRQLKEDESEVEYVGEWRPEPLEVVLKSFEAIVSAYSYVNRRKPLGWQNEHLSREGFYTLYHSLVDQLYPTELLQVDYVAEHGVVSKALDETAMAIGIAFEQAYITAFGEEGVGFDAEKEYATFEMRCCERAGLLIVLPDATDFALTENGEHLCHMIGDQWMNFVEVLYAPQMGITVPA